MNIFFYINYNSFLNAQVSNWRMNINDESEKHVERSSHDLSGGVTPIFGEGKSQNGLLK